MILDILKYVPYTSSIRHVCSVYKYFLHKKYPLSFLVSSLKNINGRNNSGSIVVRHIGGRNKRLYRYIDFKRLSTIDIPNKVIRLEYDPNRSGYIALLLSKNGMYSYVLAPHGIQLENPIYRFTYLVESFFVGYCSLLKDMPEGTSVYNVELYPNYGGLVSRSAGCFSVLIKKDFLNQKALLRFSSGEYRYISIYCSASVGTVSNKFFNFINLGKAGRSRWLGRRPHVRGVAMNPIDHPHGGGQGKKSGRVCSTSPWGKLTKGQKTSNSKNK